jgi:uncharacterized protein (UPF0335 family)
MEKNKHTLQEALARLPQYESPQQNWDCIVADLDLDAQAPSWKTQLKSLPAYAPPEDAWEQIAGELPTTSAKRRKLWTKLASAAAIALLLTVGWWQTQEKETVQLSLSQEIISDQEIPEDWDQDEESIAEVMQLAANSPMENPADFDRLKENLNELNQAKAELMALMEAYGRDPKVIREIGEIERQRSAVIKKVVTLI